MQAMQPAEAMNVLGVLAPCVPAGPNTQAQLDRVIEEWRAGPLRTAYRAAAKQHHPDMQGGSVEAMTRVNQAYDALKTLVLVRRERQRPPPVWVRYDPMSSTTTMGTTSGFSTGFTTITW